MSRGVPDAAELVRAVREFLEEDVQTDASDALRYRVRVAANALAVVERELAADRSAAPRHVEALARLGVADDEELARAIRRGALDDRWSEVLDIVRKAVVADVGIANPRHLLPDDRPPGSLST